jgi:DNA-binding phage protein
LKEEDKMRNYLNQQLEKKDEQLLTLMNDQGEVKKWRKKVEVAEEIAKVIQDEGLE